MVALALLYASTFYSLASYPGVLLTSIGGSVVASAIAYSLILLVLEPARQETQARQISTYAIAVAYEQFQEHFEVSLPTATYESSDFPKSDFRDAFVGLLLDSSRYDYKGTAGRFTTFRLGTFRDHSAMHGLHEIRLCLLDPHADAPIRAHARHRRAERHESTDNAAIAEEMEQIREDAFGSLTALFDIRDSLPTTVFLHNDLPFFWCDMFDSGMFLTYYLGGASYPATLEFSSNTRPYHAYRYSLQLTRRNASGQLTFGSEGPSPELIDSEDKLMNQLTRLGCPTDLTDPRAKRDHRFAVYRHDLERAGIAPHSLF